ncbi:rho GTPase-activating protein 39 [Trichonephila clavata]|uniref:Rho GTPase-activating protein 39 n=1 Tax=Trichonephila clavata TaxID=2740835 RepID=A0A8X6L8Y6_TRICU|nr:rho GTPase-activating protein 39 [Trichonephila clavata]
MQPRISWHESKQWDKRGNLEFNKAPEPAPPVQRPMLGNIVPVWQQHSFECWQAPTRSTPKQHSFDLASVSRRHVNQPFVHSKGKSCINFTNANEQKKRSTPQHYRKVQTKNSLSFGLDQIKHVSSSYVLENNTSYPPEAVGTPLASRRQWFVKGSRKSDGSSRKAESNASSPQNPLMPLENLQSFKRSKNNIHMPMGKYSEHNSSAYKQHSLDLPLHTYNNTRNIQRKDGRYIPELIIPLPQSNHSKAKVSPEYKMENYQRENMLTRQKYYNSCKHIYSYQNDHSGLCTTPDYSVPCCYQAENYLSPLQQYLMEQAKLSGKLTDLADDKDSFSQSDDDSDGQRDDDDHFADDEGMSHHDSSSLEYLDNYVFFDEDAGDLYYSPVLNSSFNKGKVQHQGSFKFPKCHEAEDTISSSSAFSVREVNPQPPSYYDTFGDKSDEQEYNSIHDESEDSKSSKGDIQKYAEDNLNRHTKGIFRKKFSLQDMLSWSKDPIRKPMITTTDKSLKRDACEVFKLIQTYMLDHKAKNGQTYEAVVLDIATRGWSKPALRDELYIQICRQTTENPKRESLVLGWELMAVCLTFFPPSIKFQPYLEGYIKKHQSSSLDPPDLKISQYALVCGKRLEQISHKGAARSLRKPTVEEIEQSRVQIFRPSMFGNSLEEVMALQKKRYPNYRLPWIQTTLSETVLRLNGAQTEGIFRVPGDIDEINSMKMKIDQWELIECDDPHVPASLLKQWYRELFEPLIPADYYEECITYCNDADAAVQIVKNLPELNRLVFSYLIRFLQVFSAEENCAVTKMDAKNLAMVMAPNCLRCTSEDPSVIFENTRKEMAFIQTLIQHLNTSYMEGVV